MYNVHNLYQGIKKFRLIRSAQKLFYTNFLHECLQNGKNELSYVNASTKMQAL